MNNKNLFCAMNGLDPRLIEKAAPSNQEKRGRQHQTPWLKWGGIAACFCLVVAVTVFAVYQIQNRVDPNDPNVPPVSNAGLPGDIKLLGADCKTSAFVNGTAVKYSGNLPSSSLVGAPPAFQFDMTGIAVVARAIEEMPDVYQTLNAYGSIYRSRYRVFKLEVIDPLDSGLEGSFYYALPEHLKGNLTQYDALLLSMNQRGNNYMMLNTMTNELTSFPTMFCHLYSMPELGNIIAFSDNVFDESLWQDSSWIFGYQFAKLYLDEGRGHDVMLVYRGSTLADALAAREKTKESWDAWAQSTTVNRYDFKTAAAKEVMAFVAPFENGVFVPEDNVNVLKYRRYIGGCPTNEWLMIEDFDVEEVSRSEHRFTDADFLNLPDIAAYIESLDLSTVTPQHTDTKGKTLLFRSAIGWYEKTEDVVYSIVKISWRYSKEGEYNEQYYDETFVLLEESGARIVSREELTRLIGENTNMYYGEYGVGIEMPQE